jgi:hypothetical protein
VTVTSKALWTWDTSVLDNPVLLGYGNGKITKTGLMPADLQAFVGVPLQYYNTPVTAVASGTIVGWIRDAEDWVEQATTVLLTPTWIAGPAAPTTQIAMNIGLTIPAAGFGQQLGVDYDLMDAPFDFVYQRNMNEGWGITQTRYRPLRNLSPSTDRTAMKLYSFFYPLLSEYFRVPPSWYQEDQDFGLVRLVPAENVQMLPLWAMQIAFLGYAESVPGGVWTQYTCGLTDNDYRGRFSFMKRLVLCQAAIFALQSIQGTINMGLMRHSILEDGVQYQAQYSEKGPFGSLIDRFQITRDDLLQMAQENVSGPMFITI